MGAVLPPGRPELSARRHDAGGLRGRAPRSLGTDCAKFEQFPILTKFIDASKNLSIQVHPSNDYALKNEHQYGKSEMWYVLDCVPGAYLYYGFTHEISKEEFAERIKITP